MVAMAQRSKQVRNRDNDSDDEGAELACNMTGEVWENLPFPIIIDSGACASVMPTGWCDHVPLRETPKPKAGD